MGIWYPPIVPAASLDELGGDALPLRGIRILFVEDEPLTSMCVETALRESGAIVFVAADEANALRLLEQVCSFDLLITDVNLGSGGSGFDVARAVRQHHPSTAVIYLSGRSEASVRKQGVVRADFLSKPVAEVRLIRTAVQAVERTRMLEKRDSLV